MDAWKDSRHRWYTRAETEGQASRILQIALEARGLIPVGQEVKVNYDGTTKDGLLDFQTTKLYRPRLSGGIGFSFSDGDLAVVVTEGLRFHHGISLGSVVRIRIFDYKPDYYDGSEFDRPRLARCRGYSEGHEGDSYWRTTEYIEHQCLRPFEGDESEYAAL